MESHLPGSSSSSVQSIWPETVGKQQWNNASKQMVKIGSDRTTPNANLKSIFDV